MILVAWLVANGISVRGVLVLIFYILFNFFFLVSLQVFFVWSRLGAKRNPLNRFPFVGQCVFLNKAEQQVNVHFKVNHGRGGT